MVSRPSHYNSRYGRVEAIEAANPGLTATDLYVGQVLSIPAPAP